jgi:hypothetical protein
MTKCNTTIANGSILEYEMANLNGNDKDYFSLSLLVQSGPHKELVRAPYFRPLTSQVNYERSLSI